MVGGASGTRNENLRVDGLRCSTISMLVGLSHAEACAYAAAVCDFLRSRSESRSSSRCDA